MSITHLLEALRLAVMMRASLDEARRIGPHDPEMESQLNALEDLRIEAGRIERRIRRVAYPI